MAKFFGIKTIESLKLSLILNLLSVSGITASHKEVCLRKVGGASTWSSSMLVLFLFWFGYKRCASSFNLP